MIPDSDRTVGETTAHNHRGALLSSHSIFEFSAVLKVQKDIFINKQKQ